VVPKQLKKPFLGVTHMVKKIAAIQRKRKLPGVLCTPLGELGSAPGERERGLAVKIEKERWTGRMSTGRMLTLPKEERIV
jgi:hypothetical protein